MKRKVFISYRRAGGDKTAKLICESLKIRGYEVFFDYDTLKGGYFDESILTAIERSDAFVLVLSPGSLDRCMNDPNDWVRREIRHALECGKNIIPVMVDGFDFPKYLPNDILNVSRLQGIRLSMDYYDPAIDKIEERIGSKRKRRSNSRKKIHIPKEMLKKVCIIAGIVAVVMIVACVVLFFTDFGKQLTCRHQYNVSVTEATCISEGYTTSTCPICGKVKTTNTVPAIAHSFGEWSVVKEPTCTESGSKSRRCSLCNQPDEVITQATGHTGDGWIVDREPSVYENGLRHMVCITCGESVEEGIYPAGSEGLEYDKSGQEYYVKSIGSCTAENIVIPAYVDGCKVTRIKDNAFKDCKMVETVTVCEGVTSIGKNAFKDCIALREIILPSVMKEIKEGAFSGCKSLTSITIPSGITVIETNTFKDCIALESIELPKSVVKFEAYASGACKALSDVYYEGSKAQWKDISKGIGCFNYSKAFVTHCSDGDLQFYGAFDS